MDALLLIDLQEDFLGAPGLAERRRELLDQVQRWVDLAARRAVPVIEVRTELPRDPSAWALNMREDHHPVALEGTDGTARAHELDVDPVAVVRKRRDDAFLGTDLDDRLTELGAQDLVLCGVSTEACVALTAAQAYARDYRVRLGAVASADQRAHAQALAWLAEQYRQSHVTPDDVD